MIALVIILPGAADAEAHWLRIVDGRIVVRGTGLHWQREGADRIVLIAPAATTAIHRAQLPGLARRQAEAAARLLALENSIGTAERLHVAVGERDTAGYLDVAVIDAAGLGDWIAWAQAEGFDPDAIVPAALLLTLPQSGVVEGMIGDELVARDAASGFPAEGFSDLVAEGQITRIDAAAIDAALVAAAVKPPLDLRQGRFAKRQPGVDRQLVRRCLILAACVLIASLLLALVQLAKLRWDSAALDDASVAEARRIAPQVQTPEQGEAAVNARLTSLARGGRGFASPAAVVVSAVQATPDVTLTRLDQGPGELRATISGPRIDDLNRVLIAIQEAGYGLAKDPVQNQGGRTSVLITVRAR